jgi:hypothetical protein
MCRYSRRAQVLPQISSIHPPTVSRTGVARAGGLRSGRTADVSACRIVRAAADVKLAGQRPARHPVALPIEADRHVHDRSDAQSMTKR